MTTTASFLLFVLAGAFLFLYVCHYTSYLASRTEGRQLLFRVAAVAAILVLLSRIAIVVGEAILPSSILGFVSFIWSALFSTFEVPDLPVYVGAFLLGPALAWLVNAFYDADRASTRAIKQYGSDMERLFLRAMESESLVSVTLDNRKVYIGWPVYSPNLRYETNDFRLIPSVSGYRDEQNLGLELPTQYLDIYEKMRRGEVTEVQGEDFEFVISLDRVVSANVFSLDIDQHLFEKR